MHHSTVFRFGTRQALLLACLVFVALMVTVYTQQGALAASVRRGLLNVFLDDGHLADLQAGCPVT